MKSLVYAAVAIVAISITGCASTANPVFSASTEKAYIYAPGEDRTRGTIPGATGDVRFCSEGIPGAARRKEALKAIAATCGGEDKYSMLGERMSDATGSFMGVAVQCVGNSGRQLVFKCLGSKPTPTGYTK